MAAEAELGNVGRFLQTKYEGSQMKLVLTAMCALAGALNFGIAIGYSAPSIPSMIKRGVLQKEDSSWFGSLLTIGALLGAPIGGWLMEKAGRKWSLTITSVPFIAGFYTIASAAQSYECYLGRFLTGVASGMVTVCVPVYISEISTTSMRGILGSCFQLLITVGIALTYILGVFFEWRWLSNLCIVPCLTGGILTFFLPETPRWLLMKNRKTDAIAALKTIRDSHIDVQKECREIEEGSGSEESVSFTEILTKRELLHPVILAICVLIFQQLSGINIVMFFTVSIFESAVGSFAYTATVIVGVVQVLATLVAVYLMDRAGRRKLIHIGGLIMAATLFGFGFFYSFSNLFFGFLKTWFPVSCITFYIIGFSLGWGPVPALIMSEIIPIRCKGIAGSLAILASWGSAFLVTSEFTFMQDYLGNSGLFYMFGAWCLVANWFVAKYVPETKGKSLEDIEMYFAGKSTVHV